MPLKTQQDDQPSLNLTPMIDVVFLLIIFFMVGTKFTEIEKSLDLQVPQVSDVQPLTPAPQRRVLNVYRDGRLALDGQMLSAEEVTSQLAEAQRQYAGLGVIVRGDGASNFQQIADALDLVRRAGISELGIAVRLAQQPAGEQLR